MKCYVTKYRLSEGALEVLDCEYSSVDSNYIHCRINGYLQMLKLGRDVFLDVDDARKDFENRRRKKIKSLKKQIEKLEHSIFVVK